jgi:hypothetical protein
MATENQINANRANARHSTGPRTEEGKSRVAGNRRTHALAGRHVILPTESQAGYDALLAEFVKDHAPTCTYEDTLVHQMAEAHWKLRRIGRYEAELLDKYPNPFLDDEGARKLSQLSRYEAAARRAAHIAFEDLRRFRADLQKQRKHVASMVDLALECNAVPRVDNSNPIPLDPVPALQPDVGLDHLDRIPSPAN